MSESASTPEVWSADRLMGKQVSFKGLAVDSDNGADASTDAPASPRRRKSKIEAAKLDPMLWGRPGHLTEDEVEVFFKFKAEIEKRGQDFRDTVYCFGTEEGEAFALCRWLRARKFDYDEVIKMVEEATAARAEAKAMDFYTDPKLALGCDMSVYFAQYPQLYSGFAKNGCPIFISKPGVLNVDAVECITSLQGIVKFHWYIMMHDFGGRLRAQKAKDPHFKRFECVCVLDLENLTMGQLNSKSLAIIKEQSAIDSLCFPETMNKMVIINGPRFFGATWSLIKGWLDPRTAGKIEVISSRKQWTKKLLELCDEDQLPSDYGGKGPETQATIDKENFSGKMKRLHTEVMSLRGHNSITYEIAANEELEIAVYTRSTPGAKFTITDANHSKAPWVENVEVKHLGTDDVNETPTHEIITKEKIIGPASVKVKGDSNGGRWSSYNFLIAFSVFNP